MVELVKKKTKIRVNLCNSWIKKENKIRFFSRISWIIEIVNIGRISEILA